MKRASQRMRLAKLMHHHIAISAVGASTGRNMVPKDRIRYVRAFLSQLRIEQFAHPKRFHSALERATKRLTNHKPKCVKGWGASRKFINIFLRNVTYNAYLRREYKLARIERLLEIPIDKFAADGLRDEPEGRLLPNRFKGVIHIKPDQNAAYQKVASTVARRKRTHRVHLDLVYWRREKKGN
jgi:hypothetical protein